VGEVVARELLEGEARGGRAVRLAAVVVDLERAKLVDGVRLGRRGEPMAAHFAAQAERGVVDSRAVGECPLIEAGDAAVACIDRATRQRAM
jgi:hypothetical protein